MVHTDSFTLKLLLVAESERAAREIQHAFNKAGLPEMDVDTNINNVIPKLKKERSIQGIVLDTRATAHAEMYIKRLRANGETAQLPIVVLDTGQTEWTETTKLYDAGANLVITAPLDEDVANHICWATQSLLTFVSQFKIGRERMFKRGT